MSGHFSSDDELAGPSGTPRRPKAPSKKVQFHAAYKGDDHEDDEHDDHGHDHDNDEEGEDSGVDSDERRDEPLVVRTRGTNAPRGPAYDHKMSGALHPSDKMPSYLEKELGVLSMVEFQEAVMPMLDAGKRDLSKGVPNVSFLGLRRPNYDKMSVEELTHRLGLLRDVSSPSEIVPGLYISNLKTASAYLTGVRYEELPEDSPDADDIKYVLSIIDYYDWDKTHEAIMPDEEPIKAKNQMKLNVKDSEDIRLYEWFPKICVFLHKSILRRDGGVLVHCRKGMSRSVAAVTAYLMWAKQQDATPTLQFVTSKRPVARPNDAFQRQLKLWEKTKHRIESGRIELDKWQEYAGTGADRLDPAVIFNPSEEPGPEIADMQSIMEDYENEWRAASRKLPTRQPPKPKVIEDYEYDDDEDDDEDDE